MNLNFDGKDCPNGAGRNCTCSAKAAIAEHEKQARYRKHQRRKFWTAIVPLVGVALVVGLTWIFVDYFLLRPRPLELTPFYWLGLTLVPVVALVVSLLGSATMEAIDQAQQIRELRCAVRLLLSEREERKTSTEQPSEFAHYR